MASRIWDPLEREQALDHGWQLVRVDYHNHHPVLVEVVEKHPKWTEKDIKPALKDEII